MSDKTDIAFSPSESGLVRFPPNVESISVEATGGAYTWLVVRRNETELRFPLARENCEHLAVLLLAATEGEAAA